MPDETGEKKRPLRIAYLTTYDPSDRRAFSGTGYFMAQSLISAGCDIEFVGPLTERRSFITKLKKLLYQVVLRRRYLRDREPAVLRSYGREASERLKRLDVDAVVSPGTLPVAYLETDKPVLVWTDATFSSIQNFYPQLSELAAETKRAGDDAERRALNKAAVVAYSSEWAIDSATNDYDIDRKKLKLVSFGANFESTPTTDEVEKIIHNRSTSTCQLLFMGVAWERKGGDVALAVAQHLNDMGLSTSLHVVGCSLPPEVVPPVWVTQHGFVNTSLPDGNKLINKLFSSSHYMIVPSLAECTAIVFCEAAAFGIPSISRNVGGTRSVIKHGETGYVFDVDADPKEYAAAIYEGMKNGEKYVAMASAARRDFERRLNWQTAGATIRDLVQGLAQ